VYNDDGIGPKGLGPEPRIGFCRSTIRIKVRLPFYPPYGGVTTYAEYTGSFSYDVDNKKITLLDNCGPFKRGDRVSCVYYSDFYDSLFIDGTRFG